MTVIDIKSNYYEIKGHSGYGTYGNDIVCAAISTLGEATYNYLKAFDSNVSCEEKEGYLRVSFESSKEISLIIREFSLMIEDLEKQYPNNIRRIK